MSIIAHEDLEEAFAQLLRSGGYAGGSRDICPDLTIPGVREWTKLRRVTTQIPNPALVPVVSQGDIRGNGPGSGRLGEELGYEFEGLDDDQKSTGQGP